MKKKEIKRKLTRSEVASLGGKACHKKHPEQHKQMARKLWRKRKQAMKAFLGE